MNISPAQNLVTLKRVKTPSLTAIIVISNFHGTFIFQDIFYNLPGGSVSNTNLNSMMKTKIEIRDELVCILCRSLPVTILLTVLGAIQIMRDTFLTYLRSPSPCDIW